MDMQDNDAVHGDENYRDTSVSVAKIARRQFLESLQKPGFDGREEVINRLVTSETFWEGVFSIGSAESSGEMDYELLSQGALKVNAMVELHAAQEIEDLAEAIESCS